jgi:hypothetical protein
VFIRRDRFGLMSKGSWNPTRCDYEPGHRLEAYATLARRAVAVGSQGNTLETIDIPKQPIT